MDESPAPGGPGRDMGLGPVGRALLVLTKGVDPLLQEPGPKGDEVVGDDDEEQPEGVRPEVRPQEWQQGPQFAHKSIAMSPARDNGASHT